MNPVLVPLHGGPSIHVDKAILFFGRGSECDVVLTDSRKVSRKHCCVAQINNRIVVRDLGSMNGIRVNDTSVKDETVLNLGDVLWIGDLGFRLDIGVKTMGQKAPPIPSNPAPKSIRETPRHYITPPPIPASIEKQGDGLSGSSTGNGPAFVQPQFLPQIPDDEVIELADSDIIDPEKNE